MAMVVRRYLGHVARAERRPFIEYDLLVSAPELLSTGFDQLDDGRAVATAEGRASATKSGRVGTAGELADAECGFADATQRMEMSAINHRPRERKVTERMPRA
jgi:hypothetical protein